MRTRNCLLIAFCFIFLCGKLYAQPTGSEDRMYWVQTLTRIADPVLVNLSQGTLKKNMPFQNSDTYSQIFSFPYFLLFYGYTRLVNNNQ